MPPSRESRLRRTRAALISVGLVVALLVVGFFVPAREALDAFSAWSTPYRHAWFALPAVVAVFVVLGLFMVPVLLLIAATGLAFGPWLGPVYAMGGCLASACTGFAIGRWLGLARVEDIGGARVARIARLMSDNGTLAVFLLRKVPLPFLLANMLAGAAGIRYRDFVLGTTLGMLAAVIALAGFGYHAVRVFEDPTPRTFALAAVAVAIPLTLAWTINRVLGRRRGPT